MKIQFLSRAKKISNDFHCYGKFIKIDEIKKILEEISLNDIKKFINDKLLTKQPSFFIYTNKEVNESLPCFQDYFKVNS